MSTPIDRKSITTELVKGLAAERTLAAEAKDRALAPPHPSLSVIYNELSAAEDRHCTILEIIATRYGHVPTANGGGLSETLGWLKDKVSGLGSSPVERLTYDLQARIASVLWYTTWVHTFEEIGDTSSASDLAPILNEKKTHCDALQGVLTRLVSERSELADATSRAGTVSLSDGLA